MKFLLIWIFIISFFVFPPSKKENFIIISKKYFPDNYILLKDYPETFVNFLAKGDSLSDYVFGLCTIVHEAFHLYGTNHNSSSDTVRWYRIDDTLNIPVKRFNSFPCIELNNISSLADRQKTFRYNTYINNRDQNNGTQHYGFLGLLEEYVAYYEDFKTYNAIFPFLRDNFGWKNPEIWRKYLCENGSVKYSLSEFKLYISWYLQYSKSKHPDTYKRIIKDKNIRKIFNFIDKEYGKLTEEYEINRKNILKELEGSIKIQNGFLLVIKSGNSNGLHDFETKNLITILAKPEHKILMELMNK